MSSTNYTEENYEARDVANYHKKQIRMLKAEMALSAKMHNNTKLRYDQQHNVWYRRDHYIRRTRRYLKRCRKDLLAIPSDHPIGSYQ
jgi:hypothetical protein